MLLFALALVAQTPADAAPRADPRADPNVWGQTGVVHITSARAPGNLRFDVGASGFLFAAGDSLVPGKDDFNALVGGTLSASMALLDVLELSLASRSASNANSARGPSAFSVGDLYPSAKLGFTLLPVAVGVDVRARLPTRVDAAGLDLGNVGITTQGLVTLDLDEGMQIPVRVHLNGGYVFEGGKYVQGNDGFFEDNPNFYDGVDGALLALAADSWFYDQVVGGLAVEAPLPYVTPFLEVFYRAAVGVPANRGPSGAAYDLFGDGHLTVTPGARVTALDNFTIDLGVDIGVLGTAGGGTDETKIVNGTPPNVPFLLRVGVTSTFDPFAPAGGSTARSASGGPAGQVKGCVVDASGQPVANAIVEGPALGGARLATDDAGCFLTPPLATGDAVLTVTSGAASLAVPVVVADGRIVDVTATLGGAVVPGAVASAKGSARLVGYVTNKEDETVEAELELWDASGPKPAGKAQGGAFEITVKPGDVALVARADGYLADGITLHIGDGARRRTAILLKKVPKARKAVLENDRIAVQAKVPFEFKKPRLQSTAEYVLDDVVDALLRNPTLRVRVEAWAEALPTPEESQRLADDRAAAVIDYLVQHGVWRSRLEAKGATAETDKARRVDFIIVP